MWSNMLSQQNLFSAFLLLYAIAAYINHIDDTDETHGYWEPLHFLLYGKGLQTWEYSPAYAIRTYAFIYPMYLIARPLVLSSMSKLAVFYTLRMVLGLFSAYSVSTFILSIRRHVSDHVAFYLLLFIFFSPGHFYISTSYLPSALCSNLLMLCVSEYLSDRFISSILCGCVAVIATGWPFCAVVFVPFGVNMLFMSWNRKGMTCVVRLIASGITILLAVSLICLTIDSSKYGKWTFPPWNIVRYNAIGGSGDELYGTEPASYYILNLLLTMNLAWPLAWLSVIVYFIDIKRDVASAHIGACLFSLVSWLLLLFSRPHKEERFMYPVYSLIALAAAYSLSRIFDVIDNIFCTATSHGNKKKFLTASFSTRLLRVAVIVALALLGFGRVLGLKNNYQGYMHLWKTVSSVLSNNPSSSASVCMGGDWYTFPSHFFLPSSSSLMYVSDNFHGLLPQHYATQNGTSAEPLQAFNNRNEEEIDRYVDVHKCDYIVNLLPRWGTDIVDMTPVQRMLLAGASPFEVLATTRIIDTPSSPTWSRVVFIPFLSNRKNKFVSYALAGKK